MTACKHIGTFIRVSSRRSGLDVCLPCERVRPAGEDRWRKRESADGIRRRWLREMRNSLGLVKVA